MDAQARRAGERGDGADGQRAQLGAPGRRGRQAAEQALQPGARLDLVVAVAQHEDRGEPFDAAGGHREHVQRRLVGPVHVLDDEDGGPVLQLGQHRVVHGVGAAAGEGLAQRGGVTRDVVEGAEGAGGDEVVARALEEAHRRLAGEGAGPGTQHRRLAEAGLAGEEHGASGAAAGVGEGGVQLGEDLVPLEHPHHGTTVGRHGARSRCIRIAGPKRVGASPTVRKPQRE